MKSQPYHVSAGIESQTSQLQSLMVSNFITFIHSIIPPDSECMCLWIKVSNESLKICLINILSYSLRALQIVLGVPLPQAKTSSTYWGKHVLKVGKLLKGGVIFSSNFKLNQVPLYCQFFHMIAIQLYSFSKAFVSSMQAVGTYINTSMISCLWQSLVSQSPYTFPTLRPITVATMTLRF